jgi:MFS family permease
MRTPRQWLVLRKHPDFRRLFVGNSISLLGSSVTTVALPLTAVVYLHASPAQVGILTAVAFLPHLVLGLPAGVWVDRLPYKRILVLADILQALLIGSIPVVAAFGVLHIWQLYVVVLLAGIGNLFETVTATSFTPSLVQREQLLPANSALQQSTAVVNTTGSALGGALVQLLTAPLAIAVDAASFVFAALFKLRIRTAGPELERPEKQRLFVEIVAGLRAVVAHPILRMITLTATVGALTGQIQNVVLVLYLVRELHLSPGLVGAAVAISGAAGIIGALVAVPITERAGHGPAYILGVLCAGAGGLVLAAAGGPFWLVFTVIAAGQILRGIGPSLYSINQQTLRQALTAPEMLSRINATWRFLVFGMQPVGALIGGFLGGTIGLRDTLILGSVGTLASAAIAIVSPLPKFRRLSVQPAG